MSAVRVWLLVKGPYILVGFALRRVYRYYII